MDLIKTSIEDLKKQIEKEMLIYLLFEKCLYDQRQTSYHISDFHKLNNNDSILSQKTFRKGIQSINTYFNILISESYLTINPIFRTFPQKLFYKRLLPFFNNYIRSYCRNCINCSTCINNSKNCRPKLFDANDIIFSPHFFPLFVSIVSSLGKDTQDWKNIKTNILNILTSFFACIPNVSQYIGPLEIRTAMSLYKVWLNLCFPDTLFQLSSSINSINSEIYMGSYFRSFFKDNLHELFFSTLAGQNFFYEQFMPIFSKCLKNESQINPLWINCIESFQKLASKISDLEYESYYLLNNQNYTVSEIQFKIKKMDYYSSSLYNFSSFPFFNYFSAFL